MELSEIEEWFINKITNDRVYRLQHLLDKFWIDNDREIIKNEVVKEIKKCQN